MAARKTRRCGTIIFLLGTNRVFRTINLSLYPRLIWTDQPIPNEIKEDFRMLQPFAPERGALLSIYGSGGATTNGNTIRAVMGACMIGYEIRPATNGWEAGLFGYIDP